MSFFYHTKTNTEVWSGFSALIGMAKGNDGGEEGDGGTEDDEGLRGVFRFVYFWY